MDQVSERACYINSIEQFNTPDKPKMDENQSVSPVLSRSKKYYRPGKRDTRVSLDKRRFTSDPLPDENSGSDKRILAVSKITTKIDIAQVNPTSPGKSNPESNISSKFKTDILSKIYEGFKTATGKNLSVSESKLKQQATKLFGDILNTTPAPMDQNLLNKSDSAVKRSFLTKVCVDTNVNPLEGSAACGDRASTDNVNGQDRSGHFSGSTRHAPNDLSFTSEELSKCFESDVFSQLPSKKFSRINRATEVYSNTNYNEQSTDTDSVVSDNFPTAKQQFNINDISDSELVYLADTADYLSIQNSKQKPEAHNNLHKKIINSAEASKKIKTLSSVKENVESNPPINVDKSSPIPDKFQHQSATSPSKLDHKSHTKRVKLKQDLSKNIVDPSVSPSILNTHDASLAKNIYELHRNVKFTNESELHVVEINKSSDNSILTNLMKMFGAKTSSTGITKDEQRISREVFDRHSKVLEAVVQTMQDEEQLFQKKLLRKLKHHSKQKKQKPSQKDKDSTKRKLEDKCISPTETKDEHRITAQENKRSKITEKSISESVREDTIISLGKTIKVSEKIAKTTCFIEDLTKENLLELSSGKDMVSKADGKDSSIEIKTVNSLSPTNKKLEIEIGSTNIKININSIGLNDPHIGFKSASGRDINITPKALEAAKNIYKSIEKEVEISTIAEEIVLANEKPNVKNYCGFEYPPSDTDSVSTVNDYVKQTIHDYNLNERDAKDLVRFKGAAEPVVLGFSTASGNKINVTAKSMQIAQALYEEAMDNDNEIKFDLLNSPDGESNKKVAVMFSVASDGNKDENVCKKTRDLVNNFQAKVGVTTKRIYEEIDYNDMLSFGRTPDNNFASGFSTAGGKSIKICEDNLRTANELFEKENVETKTIMDSDTSLKSARELIDDAVSSMDTVLNKLVCTKPIIKSSASKKHLGMTSAKCKPITISKQNIDRAKSFFDDSEDLRDIDPDLGTEPLKPASLNRSNISHFENMSPKQLYSLNTRSYQNSNSSAKSSRISSPIKTSNITSDAAEKNLSPSKLPVLTSRNQSPIRTFVNKKDVSPTRLTQINIVKSESIHSRSSSPFRTTNKPVNVSTPAKEGAHQNTSFHNLNITPIRSNAPPRGNNNRHDLSTIQESPSVLLMEQSSTDLTQIKADFDEECELLKRKLTILNDRKSALDLQESIMCASTDDYKKPKPGILYMLKQRSNRVPLKDLQLCSEENVEYFNVDATILNFDFIVAEQVHFNSTIDNGATVKTKDGAIIVPSVNDSMGLSEIIRGFQAMPGVDPDLIPKGWIFNHFRMIVWKLVSYERVFPHYFKNSLCLENVVQQLKYRYDREIDRAERSALRKITEKDDVPQKRMVLCVAHIYETTKHTFELDLTDGWYVIRTSIDQPLCRQVSSAKIHPGTKLMIQNAELLNCEDGCHPLQLPNHVRLRININSTRRSLWHLKLGYQHQTRPLPIRISTIHPNGGQIAYVKVYINRVYPIRYLEHDSTIKVWRNIKAEHKRSQEFEKEKCSRVESIQDKVMQDYCKQKSNISNVKMSNAELATITCSEQLLNLLEGSNDPESFVTRLSTSQRTDLMSYMQNNNLRRKEEVLAKVAQEVNAQKTMERTVTGVLRLLVTDALDNSTEGVVLNIWRPTDDILDSLVEDCVVSVFNVIPNHIRNELSSTSRTYFKVEERDCQKNNRQIVPIAMTVDSYYKPVFNEMDTVGLVVQTLVEKHRQELWLCDFQGRLLLVQIHDGSKYCCLLDNMSRGECVAVLNVLVHKPHKGYGQCVANQLSLISTYPQIKTHRDSLDMFRQRLPKDIKQLLHDCDITIEKYRISAEITNRSDNLLSSRMVVHTSFDDYVDEEAFNSSGLTAADVALSLLQIDPE